MQETQILSLGWEDSLEEEMATHSSILAWKISWTEEPCRLQSMEPQKVRQDRETEREPQHLSLEITFSQVIKSKINIF